MKSSRNTNPKTLRWIWKRSKRFLPSIVIISVLSSVISLSFVALALVSKQVLDIATGHQKGSFTVCGALLLGIVILQIVLNMADVMLRTHANGRFTISLRNYLFEIVTRRKFSQISHYHSGDLLNRFTSDTNVVITSVLNIIPSICSMVAKIVGGISALLVLDAKITLIVLILGISVPAIGRVINRKYKQMHKDCQESEGKSRSFLQECLENTVIIKTFESTKPFTRKLNQLMQENFVLKMKRSEISLVAHMSLYSFFTLGYYAILLWGAGQISGGIMTYGTLMAFLQLVNQLRAPLQNISGIMPQYYSALASAERLMELEEGENDNPAIEKQQLAEINESFKALSLSHVTFAYNDDIILENCSFDCERGKITALTGKSGSGKSTVFKLLLGLYEPQQGEIKLDDINIDSSYRALFAYVPQGNLLLSGTIRDNITLCDDTIDEREIINACKAAEIYDLIEAMPLGLDTVLSERGAGLSEGQIQRISIARALLTNAPILLLDEATCALDEATETKVLSNIKNFSDKTVIFVTHRNTSLKVCDKVIHVNDKQFSVVK